MANISQKKNNKTKQTQKHKKFSLKDALAQSFREIMMMHPQRREGFGERKIKEKHIRSQSTAFSPLCYMKQMGLEAIEQV